MENFIERMEIEETELKEKIVKGTEFFFSDKFSGFTSFEKLLLEQQLVFMRNYHQILLRRIAFYKNG